MKSLFLLFEDGVDIVHSISSISCSNIISMLHLYIFCSYMLVSFLVSYMKMLHIIGIYGWHSLEPCCWAYLNGIPCSHWILVIYGCVLLDIIRLLLDI